MVTLILLVDPAAECCLCLVRRKEMAEKSSQWQSGGAETESDHSKRLTLRERR
jgi:hypothetical protein